VFAVREGQAAWLEGSGLPELQLERLDEGNAALLLDSHFPDLDVATYRGHVGEKPMAITCELQDPLPGDLSASVAAAVA